MPLPILTNLNVCALCGKLPQMGLNRPHSQHKTKRVVRPNLGKWNGLTICASCRKSFAKPDRPARVRRVQPDNQAAPVA